MYIASNEIIPLGYRRGEFISLLATDAGIAMLPEDFEAVDSMPGDSYFREVRVPLTEPNLVILRLLGVPVEDINHARR